MSSSKPTPKSNSKVDSAAVKFSKMNIVSDTEDSYDDQEISPSDSELDSAYDSDSVASSSSFNNVVQPSVAARNAPAIKKLQLHHVEEKVADKSVAPKPSQAQTQVQSQTAQTAAPKVKSSKDSSDRSVGSGSGDDNQIIHVRELYDYLQATGTLTVRRLQKAFAVAGLKLNNDKRLQEVNDRLMKHTADEIDFEAFQYIVSPAERLVERAINSRLVIRDWASFTNDLLNIFKECEDFDKGKPADYIPELAIADPKTFAVSFCSIDGQQYGVGPTKLPFSAQSCSKPITYLIALEEHGDDFVHRFVGREPSGRNFNELCLNHDNIPHNPMINSGAIMTVSLVHHMEHISTRFRHIMDSWKKITGYSADVGFNNTVYLSERATANRNFCLGYMMQEKGAFQSGKDKTQEARLWSDTMMQQVLELYFQCCSIEVTCEAMSIVAATLANGGVCPLTGERIFSADNVRDCLSLMLSCGMYDYSGEWAYTIGLPAKSGVSGIVMVVIPNVGGLAIFSPPLDELGNSARGIQFCKLFTAKYDCHFLGSNFGAQHAPQYDDKTAALCYFCLTGDLEGVQAMVACGVDLDASDYDGRTPLHLAASGGQLKVVQYLVNKGVYLDPIDRMRGTPLSDAVREGHHDVVAYLKSMGATVPQSEVSK